MPRPSVDFGPVIRAIFVLLQERKFANKWLDSSQLADALNLEYGFADNNLKFTANLLKRALTGKDNAVLSSADYGSEGKAIDVHVRTAYQAERGGARITARRGSVRLMVVVVFFFTASKCRNGRSAAAVTRERAIPRQR